MEAEAIGEFGYLAKLLSAEWLLTLVHLFLVQNSEMYRYF
jgi:hypothetical protein